MAVPKGATYLDLFAGSFENDRRHGTGTFPGSSHIALGVEPRFTKLVFFELPGPAARLRADIQRARPSGPSLARRAGRLQRDVAVGALGAGEGSVGPNVSLSSTPAVYRSRGSTVRTLADWRRDKKTKVEQWILMPEPAIARVLGLRGVRGRRCAERLDRLFGSREWVPIHQRRRRGALTPEGMRAEFVNLYRWRLEKVLDYQTTHALQIVATGGQPVYTLIFATDSPPGDAIMGHLYKSAATKTIPAMQARAKVAKQHRLDEAAGVLRLPGIGKFEMETADPTPGAYEHVLPWAPAPIEDDSFELDEGEPDIDPVDIDWDSGSDGTNDDT